MRKLSLNNLPQILQLVSVRGINAACVYAFSLEGRKERKIIILREFKVQRRKVEGAFMNSPSLIKSQIQVDPKVDRSLD